MKWNGLITLPGLAGYMITEDFPTLEHRKSSVIMRSGGLVALRSWDQAVGAGWLRGLNWPPVRRSWRAVPSQARAPSEVVAVSGPMPST